MNIEAIKCPQCGAPVNFEDGRDFVFCSHCGTQIFRSDENNKTITYRTIDEARIKEAELKEKELELKAQKQKNLIIAFLIVFFTMIVIIGVLYLIIGVEVFMAIGLFLACVALFILYMRIFSLPRRH